MRLPVDRDKTGICFDLLFCLDGSYLGGNGRFGGLHHPQGLDRTIVIAQGLIALGHHEKALVGEVNHTGFSQQREGTVIITVEGADLCFFDIAVIGTAVLNTANQEGKGQDKDSCNDENGEKYPSAPPFHSRRQFPPVNPERDPVILFPLPGDIAVQGFQRVRRDFCLFHQASSPLSDKSPRSGFSVSLIGPEEGAKGS